MDVEEVRAALERRLGSDITGVGVQDGKVEVVLAREGVLDSRLIEQFGDVFRFSYGTFRYPPPRPPAGT